LPVHFFKGPNHDATSWFGPFFVFLTLL